MAEPWYQAAFGAFYPLLYAHRDEVEARRCLDLLARLRPLPGRAGAPVLDLGCGDGRHLALLRERGVPAVGLDLSRPLLLAARRRDPAPVLVRGDMAALPVREAALGAVLSLFTAFGYLGPAGDAAVVAGIARALVPGGAWYLDYLDVARVRSELAAGPAARQRQAGPLAVTETRRLDDAPGAAAVVKDVELAPLPGREAEAAALGVPTPGLSYAERVALHELADLDAMAAAAGLRRVAGAGDYDGRELGGGARWLLVYAKGGTA